MELFMTLSFFIGTRCHLTTLNPYIFWTFYFRIGPIFDLDYISDMVQFAKDLKFSQYTQNFFSTLLEEAECPILLVEDSVLWKAQDSEEQEKSKGQCDVVLASKDNCAREDSKVDQGSQNGVKAGHSANVEVDQTSVKGDQSAENIEKTGQSSTGLSEDNVETNIEMDYSSHKAGQGPHKMDQSTITGTKEQVEKIIGTESKKRANEETIANQSKKVKTDSVTKVDISRTLGFRNCEKTIVPMFYYDLQKRNLKNIDIPR